MAKQITYNQIEHLKVTLNLQYTAGENSHYPASVSVSCDSVSEDGDRRTIAENFTLGTEKNTPYTLKQIYGLLNSAQAGPAIASNVREAITTAIASDVSA